MEGETPFFLISGVQMYLNTNRAVEGEHLVAHVCIRELWVNSPQSVVGINNI